MLGPDTGGAIRTGGATRLGALPWAEFRTGGATRLGGLDPSIVKLE